MLPGETWWLKLFLIKSVVVVTPCSTMELNADSGMVEWISRLTPQFMLYHLQRHLEEHVWTLANSRRTMQTTVSQMYSCYSEMWRLQVMGIADFMIFTAVLHVPVMKEVFPTVK